MVSKLWHCKLPLYRILPPLHPTMLARHAASQSDSDYSYSCGTGKTMSDLDFADALSPMSRGGRS